jgi:hypothetical protein
MFSMVMGLRLCWFFEPKLFFFFAGCDYVIGGVRRLIWVVWPMVM